MVAVKRVGVLSLQGAVSEHFAMLAEAGARGLPVKRPADLDGLDGLIIPGGESTAISRLIRQNGLGTPIRDMAREKPVMGTCAGLILLATEVGGTGGSPRGERPEKASANAARPEPLGIMDMAVSRNGFGRQVDSFETRLAIPGVGQDVPAVFIRAPYIERIGEGVTPLAQIDGKIVMAESKTAIAVAFHPELTQDTRVMRYFCTKL